MTKIPERSTYFFQLMRLDRPIGTYLLLWPTLWALWFAAEGIPSFKNLLIFVLGVTLMRAAGCVINDFADRNLDRHVERTRKRPLTTGKVTEKEALLLFAGLCITAFVLVLFTNKLTMMLSLVAVLLAACYPFAKRYTHLPQVVLGSAFAWSVPMAFAAESNQLPPIIGALFIGVVVWTVAYDTFYAMVDREDDVRIGIKSTAVLLGDMDLTIIGWLQGFTLISLLLVGNHFAMGINYYLGLLVAAALFVYQQRLARNREREHCFKAFLNNNWVGLSIFIGIFTDYQWPLAAML